MHRRLWALKSLNDAFIADFRISSLSLILDFGLLGALPVVSIHINFLLRAVSEGRASERETRTTTNINFLGIPYCYPLVVIL